MNSGDALCVCVCVCVFFILKKHSMYMYVLDFKKTSSSFVPFFPTFFFEKIAHKKKNHSSSSSLLLRCAKCHPLLLLRSGGDIITRDD